MILNPEKLRKFEDDGTVWEYETEKGDFVFLAKKSNSISVGTGKYGESTDAKGFPMSFIGFNEATKHFEELIFKKENNDMSCENGNPQPPIGILTIIPNQKEYNIGIKMQDGRNAYVTITDQIDIDKNVLTFNKKVLTDSSPFEQEEKYYVDVIGTNPNIMALYPYEDLEAKEGKVSKEVKEGDIKDIQEGKDPFDQKAESGDGSETEKKDSEDDSEDESDSNKEDGGDNEKMINVASSNIIKQALAETFGVQSYERLMQFYPVEVILKEIEKDWTEAESNSFQFKIGTNYTNTKDLADFVAQNIK